MASYFYPLIISVLLHFQSLSLKHNTNMAVEAPLSSPIDQRGTMQHKLSLFSTCAKFFMLFHHTSFPSSWGLNAGGDRKRGRKGRLVEEWRNIISMRSRRGFVLCRLPSAPSPRSSLKTCKTELPVVALALSCPCVRANQDLFSPLQYVSAAVPIVTQHFGVLFFFFFGFFVLFCQLCTSLHSSWCCCAEDTAFAAWMSSQDERESSSSWFCLTCHITTKGALPMLNSLGFISVQRSFAGASRWVSPDDRFCLSVWDRPPALMSLHEFLREGGEVSFRIMNRLSHLIQNLDISGAPFSFSPSSRKNSWKDWDGKTKKKKKERKCRCKRCKWMQCLCLCVTFWSFHDFTLCAFMWTAGHRAQSISSGLHSPPGCLCVPVAVRVRDSAAQTDALFKYMPRQYWKMPKRQYPALRQQKPVDEMETADLSCWVFPAMFLFFSSLILLSHMSLCLCLEKDRLLGKHRSERSMVRKARRSSQLNSEMQMVPFKPRESEDFCFVLCSGKMQMLFCLPFFLRDCRTFKMEFSFWSR